ncbi:hypothetical protein [Streptomyces sp. DH37]|uniref:hypothetical protein n=1 Tax=Streptomyces sp. DH37 TaxID=3040122 RepID=UPI002442692B|nr:hypothetical protein [Streptomyces sp. DH37]MDG9703549.1 hypothetical protein [Streptomyces sp. DH37]
MRRTSTGCSRGWRRSPAETGAPAPLVGFSRTAVDGADAVSLAVSAAVLPVREPTGVLPPLLPVGDAVAVVAYRRHAHGPTPLRPFPAVAVGVVAGTAFTAWAGDTVIRRSIGAIPLLMAAVALWRRRVAADGDGPGEAPGRSAAGSYGVLGGAFAGRAVVARIDQKPFDRLVTAATTAGGPHLLLL